jgi:hypothetical protein
VLLSDNASFSGSPRRTSTFFAKPPFFPAHPTQAHQNSPPPAQTLQNLSEMRNQTPSHPSRTSFRFWVRPSGRPEPHSDFGYDLLDAQNPIPILGTTFWTSRTPFRFWVRPSGRPEAHSDFGYDPLDAQKPISILVTTFWTSRSPFRFCVRPSGRLEPLSD